MPNVPSLQSVLRDVAAMLGDPTKISVGFLPTLRDVFEVPAALEMVTRLKRALAEHPNIELFQLEGEEFEDGVVRPESDVMMAWQEYFEALPEVMLAMPANYGHEGHTADICRKVHGAFGTPVFTYAPFDGPPREDGTRPTDRTCGIFPMRHELRHAGINPGYIPMSVPEDAVFAQGVKNMLRVAGVVREVRDLRILQIGGDQPTFPAIVANKLDLYASWGVRVEVGSMVTIVENVRARLADPPEWLNEAAVQLFEGIDVSEAEELDADITKKITLAIYGVLEMLLEHNCTALTVRCWPEVLRALGVMVCFGLGQMNEWGVPTACETDINGLLSMAMLNGAALGENKAFFADNTITLEDGRILIWHCGPFCRSTWREGGEPKLRTGWILPDPGAGYIHTACLALGDTVTLCRLSTNMWGEMRVYTHEAKVVDGPDTRGTYLYIDTGDWPKYEQELMNAGVVHHWAVIKGEYMHAVAEAARWLGVPPVILAGGEDEVNARIRCIAARG